MNKINRLEIIKQRLQEKFNPIKLEVIDDSHLHIGHEGSKGGAGHYTVIIYADDLKNKSKVDAHRHVYSVLNDLIPHEIHALKIIIK